MKIQKITVPLYGPLRDITMTTGNFECIFGLNEKGKTALVEVMTYLLFKKTAAALRYAKPKEAIITIDDNGELFALPVKKATF